ncbi:MAG: hypothetical protein QME51_06910 [Planctomycetota bacterium]|nr:hypothetical protein [Planctomycetota bacterium]MDI6788083.1 hypothetical protein [Planctomycetota bacterium]
MNNEGKVFVATVLVISTIILLLGITMDTYKRIKVELMHCHLDNIRAKMLAQQGMETAINKLRDLDFTALVDLKAEKEGGSWYYYGEDLDKNNLLNKGEDINNNKVLDIETCLLNSALRPSFALTDTGDNPLSIYLQDGRKMGYSGELSQTYEGGKDIYILKVIDSNSQININSDDKGSQQLLNNLGYILGISAEIPGGQLGNYLFEKRSILPVSRLAGQAGQPPCPPEADSRPEGLRDSGQGSRKKTASDRFKVKEELLNFLPQNVYNKLKHYVTLYGQPDGSVIKPSPRRVPERTSSLPSLQKGIDIFSWKEMTPVTLTLETRYPININTASKPVLMAVLANLEGVYLHQSGNTVNIRMGNEINNPLPKISKEHLSIGKLKTIDLKIPENKNLIETITERIIEERNRSPFLDWQRFHNFCDALVEEGVFGDISTAEGYETSQARADLIKANANPNTLLNKFNPDRIVYRSLDKSDLITYTTEFCFTSRGYFEIESLGVVLKSLAGQSGQLFSANTLSIEASYLTRGVVQVYAIYTETSQEDFSRGNITPAGAGMSYPESDINPESRRDYVDGLIGLATVQNNRSGNNVTFKCHFNLNEKHSGYVRGSVFDGGMLYPDGVYSDATGCPSYPTEGNFETGYFEKSRGKKLFAGALSFWLKPNYYQTSTKPRTIFSINKKTDNPQHPKYGFIPLQNIFSIIDFPLAYSYNQKGGGDDDLSSSISVSPGGKYIWFWEIDQSLGNQPQQYVFAHPSGMSDEHKVRKQGKHHQWVHIGIAWNTHPKLPKEATPCPACEKGGDRKVSVPEASRPRPDFIGVGTGRPALVATIPRGTGGEDEPIKSICRYCLGTGEKYQIKLNPSDVYAFCVNGDDSMSKYVGRQPAVFPPEIIQHIDFSSGNFMRWGENSDAPFWNLPGDFTIDEILIRLIDDIKIARADFKEEFAQGRYYKQGMSFTSGSITIRPDSSPGRTRTIPIWTVYYPDEWDNRRNTIALQLLNNEEVAISPLYETQGNTIEISPSIFRYRIFIPSSSGDDFNKPLLESPFIDDISFIIFKDMPEIIEQFMVEE